MTTPAIALHGLTMRFGERTAVDGVSLAVERGEIFGYLGPNGAGTTTTIKVLAGLLRPTAGDAQVLGDSVVAEPMAAKARIGYIPDHPFLYGKLTGRELLRFVAGLYRMTPEETRRERRARAAAP